ncbi:MAG: T9SS type A sorting domain-containing protein, partial [Cytophagales bacterium]
HASREGANVDSQFLIARHDRPIPTSLADLGQTCRNVHVVPGNQEFEVNIGNLSAGMYVARFSWNGKTYSKKFVVH